MEYFDNHYFEHDGEEKSISVERSFQGAWMLSTFDDSGVLKQHQYIDYSLEDALENFKEKVYEI